MKTKFVIILPALLIMFLLINCSNSKINTKTNKPGDTPVLAMDASLQDTYWRLIALGEKSIDTSKNIKEMYIVFKSENNRAEGNGGCNTFAGPYQLKGDSSIFLGELASTKMFCQGIENENAFFMALSAADHFQIHDDTLILSKGSAVKLATFIAVKRIKKGTGL
jgi:heat shock protein HslJ